MNHRIEHGPSFAWLRVGLDSGDQVQAEAGAMVSRDTQVQMTTHLNAGVRAGFFRKLVAFFVALCRKMFGGETMFVNRFSSMGPGEVILAPAVSGHIVHKQLTEGSKLFVQTGSYLASTGQIDTKVRFSGLRSLLGGEGLVLLECSGAGDLWVNSYGGVLPLEVNGNFTVDTGHIVAFDGTLDFKVKSVGGFKSLLLSGEGLVCEFSGRGTVYIQSRNLGALASWLTPLLPS
ncbi:MAG TPA: TIGR00266 family protein [Polyangiaceae bacterium]|nr:TIGR00266 family protein [Polyangiaceae bacterium]